MNLSARIKSSVYSMLPCTRGASIPTISMVTRFGCLTLRPDGASPHSLEVPVRSLMVTQESNPKLIVSDEAGATQVFDAVSFRHERSIETPASVHFEDF